MVQVRVAKKGDAEAIMGLRLQLVKAYPGVYGISLAGEKRRGLGYYKKVVDQYSKPGTAIFLAEENSQVVGMVKIERTRSKFTCYVSGIGVLSEYKGRGVGKLLQNAWFKWVKEKTEYKKARINMVKTNNRAFEFARKVGFKVVGEGTYRGVPELDLEMEVER